MDSLMCELMFYREAMIHGEVYIFRKKMLKIISLGKHEKINCFGRLNQWKLVQILPDISTIAFLYKSFAPMNDVKIVEITLSDGWLAASDRKE